MSNHKEITDDEEFMEELIGAGPNKLIIADFNATWCGPCNKIRPAWLQLTHKFPSALFLGVDVDLCRETAMDQGVSAMPTFILYKNSVKIDTVRGANAEELEDRIRHHYEDKEEPQPKPARSKAISTNANSTCPSAAPSTVPTPVPAPVPTIVSTPVDMTPYLDRKHCEARNQAPMTPFSLFLAGKTVIKSDLDEQLILSYNFTQDVKLHSFKIKSSVRNGPKRIKFFINQSHILDFDTAETMVSAQDITLNEKELSGKHYVDLRSLRVQPTRALQMFIAGNQTGDEVTQIDSLTFYGIPVAACVSSPQAQAQAQDNNLREEFKKLVAASSTRGGRSGQGQSQGQSKVQGQGHGHGHGRPHGVGKK